jgi:protein gp37
VVHSHPDTPVLNWIIVGGESGSGFRPMQIEWAESIRQQCEDAGTAFFFKQDSAHKSGQRGRASDALWACKQFPEV